MNFFRLGGGPAATGKEEDEQCKNLVPPAFLLPSNRRTTTAPIALSTDPEMDEAIEEMKERLSNVRARSTLQRLRNQKEIELLRTANQKANQRLVESVETIVQRLCMAPYLEATKQVARQTETTIGTGVVVTLQAKLLMHIHGMCCQNEQITMAQRDQDEIGWWFEDMVKLLRREQAEQELYLMNEIVQKKIYLSELVDAKKLREKRQRQQREDEKEGGREGIVVISQNSGGGKKNRRRTVRQICSRGTTTAKATAMLQKTGSSLSLSSRNSNVYRMCRGSTGSSNSNNPQEEALKSSLEEMQDNAEKDVENDNPPIVSNRAASSPTAGLPPPSDEIASRRAARAESRAHLAVAGRSGGRPIQRGVQRTRSKSLTNMTTKKREEEGKEGRGGRKRGKGKLLLQRQSKDDTGSSTSSTTRRKSAADSKQQQQLLVDFPGGRSKGNDSGGRTRELLLRDFSPLPPPIIPASPVVSPHSSSSKLTRSDAEEGSFASAMRSWGW